MATNRMRTSLLAVAIGQLIVSFAMAQPPSSEQELNAYGQVPYGPYSGDFKWFEPGDFTSYGGYPEPAEGWFATYDYLRWMISKPDDVPVGNTDVIGFRNSLETGFVNNTYDNGYRYEGGYIHDYKGWLVSGFKLRDVDTELDSNDVAVTWDTPEEFPAVVPAFFGSVNLRNSTSVWGVEASRLWRAHRPNYPDRRAYYGGLWEFFGGFRFMKFDEWFDFLGEGGLLDATDIDTRADNSLVGFQLGTRASWTRGRMTVATEGRFMAAANFQHMIQQGVVASNLPPILPVNANSFYYSVYETEFSPLGELRVQATWNVFSQIAVGVGWNGIIVGGIARPSKMVDYSLPSAGIIGNENRQDVFIQGLNVHFELNR